jgi:cyclopropane fatty-acyl-phospholipid synthase-like methyltransferase
MYRLAPGNILQLMHLKRRLQGFSGKRFVEVGAGNGHISNYLLELGMRGRGLDLNESACHNNRTLNQGYIDEERYTVEHTDFMDARFEADVIISSMVIEHLDQAGVDRYFEKCRDSLQPGGLVITFVPGDPGHWGIEDEIAGHQKRYTFRCFDDIARRHQLELRHQAGLTYPLSNWLFPLSNYLVRRWFAGASSTSSR